MGKANRERNSALVQDWLAGMPLRDVCAKYGIAHQRVYQIIEAAGIIKRERSRLITNLRDQHVYDTIVNYKMNHDGNSPKMLVLSRLSGVNVSSLRMSLCRLEAKGLIKHFLPAQATVNEPWLVVINGEWKLKEQD